MAAVAKFRLMKFCSIPSVLTRMAFTRHLLFHHIQMLRENSPAVTYGLSGCVHSFNAVQYLGTQASEKLRCVFEFYPFGFRMYRCFNICSFACYNATMFSFYLLFVKLILDLPAPIPEEP